MKKLLSFALLVIMAAFALTATPALAGDREFLPIVPLFNVSEADGTYADDLTFAEYVQRIFDVSIGIGGILAVVMLVYGGFEYMTSEATGGKKNGLERIRNALLGLLLLVTVVIILNVINPCLTRITALSGTASDDVCAARPDIDAARVEDPAEGAAREPVDTVTENWQALPVPACIKERTFACQRGDAVRICIKRGDGQYRIDSGGSCEPGDPAFMCAGITCENLENGAGDATVRYPINLNLGTLVETATSQCPTATERPIPICFNTQDPFAAGTEPVSGACAAPRTLKYFCFSSRYRQ